MLSNLKRFLFERVKSGVLPNWISNLLASINNNPNNIFGKEYSRHLNKIANSNSNSNIKEELLKIVNYSIKNVPYYRELYNGITINSIEEFKSTIKTIDKETVLNNFDKFISEDFDPKKYDFCTTSGTSGIPLKLYLPKSRYGVELSTIHNSWRNLSFNFSKRAVLRMENLPKNKKILINPITKEYIFDGFRLNDDYFKLIFKYLKKYNIKYIHGYPSNLFLFGKFLLKMNLDYSFIKGITSSSEEIPEYMKTFFVNQLKIPHLDFYGHTEKLIFATTRSRQNYEYYTDNFYGYSEVLDHSNIDTQSGDLVGTTLNNFGMPLLRYKTGDQVKLVEGQNPYNQKKGLLTIRKIIGRSANNLIYYNDNTTVTSTALVLHGNIYNQINGVQYFQKTKGKLEIRIIKNNNFNADSENYLHNFYRNKFKNKLTFNIVYVNFLERNKNGKLLLLISEIQK